MPVSSAACQSSAAARTALPQRQRVSSRCNAPMSASAIARLARRDVEDLHHAEDEPEAGRRETVEPADQEAENELLREQVHRASGPRYALRTCGSCSRSAPVPSRTMRPPSMT